MTIYVVVRNLHLMHPEAPSQVALEPYRSEAVVFIYGIHDYVAAKFNALRTVEHNLEFRNVGVCGILARIGTVK
ncbi:MAG: hypothetical protein E5X59_06340 [Mesorhizobium sp.]|nr:MAG: hypothetical protein E5X59_06340 [Mesorhizobium sp.]